MVRKQRSFPEAKPSRRTPDRVRTQQYRERRSAEGRSPLALLIARDAIEQLDAICEFRGMQRHEVVAQLVQLAYAELPKTPKED